MHRVANVHYRVKETGSTIPEATSSESSMAEVTIVNQEEGVDAIPSAGGSIEPETSLRSVEEDIQEAAEEESDSGGEAHVYDTPFVNISQQHLISNSQQNITNSMCDNSTREYFQNSLSESFSLDIQESQQDIETAAGNSVLDQPAVTITLTFEDESHVQDIPGFHDPELKGVDEESGGLCVTVPPNIYSSQILSTVTENQDDCQEETETCGTETAGMGIEIGSEIHTYMNIGKYHENVKSWKILFV